MEIQHLPIATLSPHPQNYNRHPEAHVRELMASLSMFDQFKNIVVCQGKILAGHGLVEAAKRKGMTHIYAVVRDDLTPEQQLALLVADNATPFLSVPDHDALQALLADIPHVDIPGVTDEWLAAMAELADAEEPILDGDADADDVPEDTGEVITAEGEVWQLGQHRLMCGDSTAIGDVRTLMAGEMADMIFTDPPYNVAYEGATADKLTILNDHFADGESFYQFLLAAMTNMAAVSRPGGAIYVCHADSEGLNFRRAFITSGFLLKQTIIWNKNQLVMGRQDYQWKHEPILYGWRDGGSHHWFGDRTQTTVWDIDKPQRNGDHPTMKPVELVARAIGNSSQRGHVVLDLFGGSGSTLAACEQTGRRCFTMELSPRYATVIIRRWEALTGQTAEKISA